jgi:MFS family permease
VTQGAQDRDSGSPTADSTGHALAPGDAHGSPNGRTEGTNITSSPGIPTSRTAGAPADAPEHSAAHPAPAHSAADALGLTADQSSGLHDSPTGQVDAAPPTAGRPATYRDVFSVRPYRYLFAASCLSMLGDQLTKVALSFLVFNRTGSAALAAAAYAIAFVPWVVGGPLLSSYADLLPRKQVMVVCDIARVVLVGVLALPGMPVPVLIVVLFVANLFAPPFLFSRAALMPDLLEGDRYVVANGMDGLVKQGTQVAGFLIGGAAVQLLHPPGALLADAGTFLLSALLILRAVPNVPAAAGRAARFSLWRDTRSGVRIVFGNPTLRAYVTLFWVTGAFTFAFEGIAVPFARELKGGPRAAGVILATAPLGIALGSFVLTRLVSPGMRMRLLVPFALLAPAALIPALFTDSLAVVLVLLFVAGVGSAFTIPLNSLFVRAVPNEYRGRAFGVAESGVQALQGIAMVAAGIVAGLLNSPSTVIGWCGILGAIASIAVAYKLWPRDAFHRGR